MSKIMRKIKIKKIVTTPLLAYLAVSLPIFGAEVNLPVATDLSSHGVTQAELNGLDTVMLQAIEQGKIKGCSYLVAHKGEIVYRKAHGAFTTQGHLLCVPKSVWQRS